MCISETHTDAANRTTRPALSTTGPSWSVVASIRRESSAGSTFMMRRHPVNATRRGAPSCRSRRVLATGAAGGMWAIRPRPVERAAASIAAAGAMQSCAILLGSVHPWGPARPSKRPSQVVTWLLCANAAGRCHERLGGTSGNPWAAVTAIAALCIVRVYIYKPCVLLLLYGGSINVPFEKEITQYTSIMTMGVVQL